MARGYLKNKPKIDFENSPIMEMRTMIPKSLYQKVKKYAEENTESMSLVWARIVERGLNSSEQPMTPNYDWDERDLSYKDLEAFEIYLRKFNGLALDHLLLLRDEIGVSRDSLIQCYCKLLDDKRIKIFKTKHNYPMVSLIEKIPL